MSRLNPPFETAYIGSVLFTLGFLSGKQPDAKLSNKAVCQLQQKPYDTLLGELFTAWQGRNFLIEFKRAQSEVTRELYKPDRRRLLATLAHPEHKAMRELASRLHFLGFGAQDDNGQRDLGFIPYALIPEFRSGVCDIMLLNHFCLKLLRSGKDATLGGTAAELQAYLDFMEDEELIGEATGFSGFIINISDSGIKLIDADRHGLLAAELDPGLPSPDDDGRDNGR